MGRLRSSRADLWPWTKMLAHSEDCTLDIGPLLTPSKDDDPAVVADACQKRMQETMDKLINLRDASKKNLL